MAVKNVLFPSSIIMIYTYSEFMIKITCPFSYEIHVYDLEYNLGVAYENQLIHYSFAENRKNQ